MNKKIKAMLSILILVVILAMQISYAVSNTKTAKTSFMELNKDEISIGETLEITFNLSGIKDYDNFTIKLSSNVTLNSSYFDEKSNLKLSANKDSVNIDINKSELNLDKITLYYDVPKTVSVGDIIEFNVNVTTGENNQEKENKEAKKSKESKTDENTTATTEIKILDESKKVSIIEPTDKNSTETDEKEKNDKKAGNTEESEEKKSNETSETKDSKQSKNDTNEKTTSSQKSSEEKSSSKVSTNATKSSSGSGSGSSSSQTATYKGSNNNYLSNIELEGINLNTSFNKENTTYFATVKNVSSLNIIATAEDSTASVNYTGNDNIQIGENKILISVTAQNGNVRYYRIYITCEEE